MAFEQFEPGKHTLYRDLRRGQNPQEFAKEFARDLTPHSTYAASQLAKEILTVQPGQRGGKRTKRFDHAGYAIWITAEPDLSKDGLVSYTGEVRVHRIPPVPHVNPTPYEERGKTLKQIFAEQDARKKGAR